MNLSKLFEMQRKLDERIIEEKGLQGQNLLDKKILALQVELGELANEWRGFKFWSNDQEARIQVKIPCRNCGGHGEGYFAGYKWTGQKEKCIVCNGTGIIGVKNPLLEEYVDGLHFLLSIGLEIGCDQNLTIGNVPKRNSLIDMFMDVFKQVAVFDSCLSDLKHLHKDIKNYNAHRVHYSILLDLYLELGQMLGFTWDEIEQAYIEKNAENHRRQEVGY